MEEASKVFRYCRRRRRRGLGYLGDDVERLTVEDG